MNVWRMLFRRDPPLLCDTFRTGLWEDLASIKWCSEDFGWWGPMDPTAFNPLLCSAKPWKGCKFEPEDSAQIAVTLARKRNQGQSRKEELGCPPPALQILSASHLWKTQYRHTRTIRSMYPAHVFAVVAVRLWAQSREADEHTYSQARKTKPYWASKETS